MTEYDKSPSGHAWVLIGPTASGKTAVAQILAERYKCDILSADSMLVYRGMDIGTAKPSLSERGSVRYWGVDLVSIEQPFTVAIWLADARRAIAANKLSGRPLIVTGGTGLYVRCVLEGLEAQSEPDRARRLYWENRLAREGIGALQSELKTRAPDRYADLADPANPRRVIRALELVESGAASSRSWRAPETQHRVVGLRPDAACLARRIEQRVHAMYAHGLLDEVAVLRSQGFGSAPTAGQAIGYAEALACLDGRMTLPEAQSQTAIRTRQLAKRQMTWFRHQANVEWVDVSESDTPVTIADRVDRCWQALKPAPIFND